MKSHPKFGTLQTTEATNGERLSKDSALKSLSDEAKRLGPEFAVRVDSAQKLATMFLREIDMNRLLDFCEIQAIQDAVLFAASQRPDLTIAEGIWLSKALSKEIRRMTVNITPPHCKLAHCNDHR